jgi:hypothetical protein
MARVLGERHNRSNRRLLSLIAILAIVRMLMGAKQKSLDYHPNHSSIGILKPT